MSNPEPTAAIITLLERAASAGLPVSAIAHDVGISDRACYLEMRYLQGVGIVECYKSDHDASKAGIRKSTLLWRLAEVYLLGEKTT